MIAALLRGLKFSTYFLSVLLQSDHGSQHEANVRVAGYLEMKSYALLDSPKTA